MNVEIFLPEGFPVDELIQFGSELISAGIVAPGFIPPGRGALDPFALHYMQAFEGRPTRMLLDLNIVSEIANAASSEFDSATPDFRRSIGKLMAVAQFNDILLDPSLAIHEQAQSKGHEHALKTLEWFRAGDNAPAWAWLEIARGTSMAVSGTPVQATVPGKLDKKIERFRRNYLLALKIAELKLDPSMSAIRKLQVFIEWIQEHMYWTGSAALFAATYLSPKGPKAGMMSRLRAADRSVALNGVRRQAWDLTHLSEFGKAVAKAGDEQRLLFGTKDHGLAILASLVSIYPSASEIEEVFSDWWGPVDATKLGQMYSTAIEDAEAARNQIQPISGKPESWIADETLRLEEKLETWCH